MPRAFSVASWNVEHFRGNIARVQRVASFIAGQATQDGGPAQAPEIFALFEVEGRDIFQEFMIRFPNYNFHITEGKQLQEIFIGVREDIQFFSTQRLEFKTQREGLRPGLLLTVRIQQVYYPLLFLHTKSGDNPEDFGLRDAALNHAFNLKRTLDRLPNGPANFIFMGDLNSMGIDDPVPFSRVLDFSQDDEITRLQDWARRRNMIALDKPPTIINGVPRQVTWFNGSNNFVPSNLDHVIASNQMDIRSPGGGATPVALFGWPILPQNRWASWFMEYSDHAMLYFEVWSP
ncbi:MAG: endonuclease/exonuclease/phosphatase family protein [Chloroflexota bacterium]|nr:MAG: endonuclease/exonuclease/phosphatase family protein [Chloroflexota bacterium]